MAKQLILRNNGKQVVLRDPRFGKQTNQGNLAQTGTLPQAIAKAKKRT